nr:protein FAM136A-like [Dasypus novemcinctus]
MAGAAAARGGGHYGEESGEREHQEDAGTHVWCRTSCCEESQASLQQVHEGIECCHAPLAQAQALVTSKLEKFQDCLAGCTLCCNDWIDAGSKEVQVMLHLESCVIKCGDDHMHLIPSMTKKMESLSSMGK